MQTQLIQGKLVDFIFFANFCAKICQIFSSRNVVWGAGLNPQKAETKLLGGGSGPPKGLRQVLGEGLDPLKAETSSRGWASGWELPPPHGNAKRGNHNTNVFNSWSSLVHWILYISPSTLEAKSLDTPPLPLHALGVVPHLKTAQNITVKFYYNHVDSINFDVLEGGFI